MTKRRAPPAPPAPPTIGTDLPVANANMNPQANNWNGGQFNIPGYNSTPINQGMFGDPRIQQLIQMARMRFGGGMGQPQGMPMGQPGMGMQGGLMGPQRPQVMPPAPMGLLGQ